MIIPSVNIQHLQKLMDKSKLKYNDSFIMYIFLLLLRLQGRK